MVCILSIQIFKFNTVQILPAQASGEEDRGLPQLP